MFLSWDWKDGLPLPLSEFHCPIISVRELIYTKLDSESLLQMSTATLHAEEKKVSSRTIKRSSVCLSEKPSKDSMGEKNTQSNPEYSLSHKVSRSITFIGSYKSITIQATQVISSGGVVYKAEGFFGLSL